MDAKDRALRPDQTVYLVVDRFGRHSSVYRETEIERTDLETIIADLMSGQFNDPVRVVAFNTLEHWLEDVSKVIADEIQTRCDIEGVAGDHWAPQLSNSGKTTRWMGYLTGSDGSTIEIKNEHINNRRNDAKRNWGLPE